MKQNHSTELLGYFFKKYNKSHPRDTHKRQNHIFPDFPGFPIGNRLLFSPIWPALCLKAWKLRRLQHILIADVGSTFPECPSTRIDSQILQLFPCLFLIGSSVVHLLSFSLLSSIFYHVSSHVYWH